MLDGREHLPPVFMSLGAARGLIHGPDVPKGDASPVFDRVSGGLGRFAEPESNVFPVKSLYKARVSGEFGCTERRDA